MFTLGTTLIVWKYGFDPYRYLPSTLLIKLTLFSIALCELTIVSSSDLDGSVSVVGEFSY